MYVTTPQCFLEARPVLSEIVIGEALAARCNVRPVEAGSMIFCDGDPSTHVYEVLEGVVRTSKFLADGRRQVISFGYPGDLIGVSHDCRYHSDCDAVSDVKVRVYRKNACSVDTNCDGDLSAMLLRHAATELNSMQEHFLMLGRKSALEKVASFINTLSARVGIREAGGLAFDLPMSRTDIGDFLGLTIETVSRAITRLRKSGIIELPHPHHVIVRQPSKLAAVAEREV